MKEEIEKVYDTAYANGFKAGREHERASDCGSTKNGNSRVLKFRAWNGAEFYKPFCPNTCDPDIIPTGLEWMQFTGLLDCNGKEIYEGDIIKQIDGVKTGIVEITPYETLPFDGTGAHCFEVVGNIYSNPELLTSK